MARTTKALSGGGKDKVLRGVVTGVEGVDPDVGEAVVGALSEAITEVRVRREVWDAVRAADQAVPVVRPAPTATPSPPALEPVAPPPPARTFDPYAFSAVAVFTRKGVAGLTAELDRITAPADLQALATAQHLGVDPALTDPATLRTEIIKGVERRIAERQAAAG
jgi:hypothetical protein